MKNKQYLLSLNEAKTEKLKVWLESQGLTLSKYVDTLLQESQQLFETLKVPADVENMTIGQFSRLAGKMMVNLSKKEKSKK